MGHAEMRAALPNAFDALFKLLPQRLIADGIRQDCVTTDHLHMIAMVTMAGLLNGL